jgi:hypothetical protein
VERYIRQALVSHWSVGLPDETRAVLDRVRAGREDGGFEGKSPHARSDTQIHGRVARATPATPTGERAPRTDTHFTPDGVDGADGSSNGAGLRRQGRPLRADEPLTADICRRCNEAMSWPEPCGVTYGDGTAEHHVCRLLLAAGERAVAGAVAVSGDGELVEGDRQ